MIKQSTNILPLILMLISTSVLGQSTFKAEKLEVTADFLSSNTVVCYLGGEIKNSIPFPAELRNIKARSKSSSFKVTYVGFDNFPEAQAAFQFAVDIWEVLVDSPQPIHVLARFSPLDPGVLGSAIPATFIRNFTNTPKFNIWFPIALAEKISNQAFNDEEKFDIETQFSSNANWYFDTDNPSGITGSAKTDFATVVLHELGHGLGFMGITDVDDGGIGTIGLNDFPMTYTTFAETTSNAKSLVTDIVNGSAEMGSALTGGIKFAGNSTALLYTPNEFAGGSTFSHLDNIFNGTANELMTPSIGSGGFMHHPGIALELMGDFGWEFTYLLHDQIQNTENFNQDFDIIAKVTSDVVTGFDANSLNLRYSSDGFDTEDITLLMTPTGNLDEYKATIPNPGVETTFSYYIEVTDNVGRDFRNPGSFYINNKFEFISFGFTAAVDDINPEIEHEAIEFVLEDKSQIEVIANITDDFIGVDTAHVEYTINNTTQTSFGLIRDPDDLDKFAGLLKFPNATAGDVIRYKIVAFDNSAAKNSISHPATGLHEFFIESIADPVTEYKNDFNTPTTDFLGNGFEIITPSGFEDGAIHSLHPYEEAKDQDEINYIYQLKSPIIVQQDQTEVKFDEIVLVEPGENGSIFGAQDFWDFVVVEVSKDLGATWFHIIAGYDSRDNIIWLNRFESAIDSDDNSTALGEQILYRTRTFDLLDNPSIKSGDQILFRFRLFSDQLVRGWGWAIDNLQIQGEMVLSLDDFLDVNGLNIYPNPSTTGMFTFSGTLKKQPDLVRLEVLDLMGKRVFVEEIHHTGLNISHQFDLSNQPEGLYFASIVIDGERITRKIFKSR